MSVMETFDCNKTVAASPVCAYRIGKIARNGLSIRMVKKI